MGETVRRIGLIGCAGLGKSMAADAVSRSLGIPFLRSKDITRPILERNDYTYSEERSVESFLGVPSIEYEITARRIEEESLLRGGFVTDRTTVECFAYALMSSSRYSEEDLSLLEDECHRNSLEYTHLFYFPQSSGWLEFNGIRTMDSSYQRQIDYMIRGIAEDWGLERIDLPQDMRDIDAKISYILGKL